MRGNLKLNGKIRPTNSQRRWGSNDELGALNLITPQKTLEALALAHGIVQFKS